MVIFKFSCLDRKYPFWSNLVQKFTIVCLRWNLIPRLIEICETQWGCSFPLLWSRNIFSRKIGQEFSVVIRFCSSYLILIAASFKYGKLLKIPEKASALPSVLFNFETIHEQTFYFQPIIFFPVKHILKHLDWTVVYVNNLYYNTLMIYIIT